MHGLLMRLGTHCLGNIPMANKPFSFWQLSTLQAFTRLDCFCWQGRVQNVKTAASNPAVPVQWSPPALMAFISISPQRQTNTTQTCAMWVKLPEQCVYKHQITITNYMVMLYSTEKSPKCQSLHSWNNKHAFLLLFFSPETKCMYSKRPVSTCTSRFLFQTFCTGTLACMKQI